jgi:molybdenum cofactor cytidylyltransferase
MNPEPARGMFSSIQAGLSRAEGMTTGSADSWVYLVLPADMPAVRPETIRSVTLHCHSTGGVVSPRYRGRRGHPVAIPPARMPPILRAEPTGTLADVLDRDDARRVEITVDDAGILRDVDEPGDLRIDPL